MVAGDNSSRGVQPHGKAGLKGERGLRAPWRRLRPFQFHGGFQSRRGKASSTTTSGVCSAIGSYAGGRQLQSHPRPSPADGRLKASDFIGRGAGHRYETARYRRRPLRWPQHRHTSRWPPPNGWKANIVGRMLYSWPSLVAWYCLSDLKTGRDRPIQQGRGGRGYCSPRPHTRGVAGIVVTSVSPWESLRR